MLKSIDRKVILTAVISAFLFSACSKSEDKDEARTRLIFSRPSNHYPMMSSIRSSHTLTR